MEVSGYVGRRILCKYWNCSCVKQENYESVYRELEDYYKIFKDFGFDRISELKIHKRNNSTNAVNDLKKVYEDLTREVNDFHSIKNLRLLYIVTKFFLKIYKDDPIISANIVFSFQLMTYDSQCWKNLLKRYNQRNEFCILL